MKTTVAVLLAIAALAALPAPAALAAENPSPPTATATPGPMIPNPYHAGTPEWWAFEPVPLRHFVGGITHARHGR
jgi:hypothetical protein